LIEQSAKVNLLRKKLSGNCPCGYFFGTFNDEKEAIVKVKLHFERFHKDFLPFGITSSEALALLKKGTPKGQEMVSSNNFSCLEQNRKFAQQIT
jgi:hypothetical protein